MLFQHSRLLLYIVYKLVLNSAVKGYYILRFYKKNVFNLFYFILFFLIEGKKQKSKIIFNIYKIYYCMNSDISYRVHTRT